MDIIQPTISEEEIARAAAIKITQVESAKKIFYAEMGGEPEEPIMPSFWASVGLSGWLTTLSFVALSLISANTVATELYLQAVTYTAVMASRIPLDAIGGNFFKFVVEYSPIIMLACAPGFELAIANYGFTEARRQKKLDFTRTELYAPMAVLILSGLSRSLVLTREDSPIYTLVQVIRFFMEIATAVGAPLTAFTASKIFATLFNQWDATKETLRANWKAAKDEIDSKFISWQAKNAHKLGLGDDRRDRKFTQKAEEDKENSMNISKAVREFLADNNLTAIQIGESGIMKPEDVADKLGITDASGKAALRQALSRLRTSKDTQ